jgi:hypothetical protein
VGREEVEGKRLWGDLPMYNISLFGIAKMNPPIQ